MLHVSSYFKLINIKIYPAQNPTPHPRDEQGATVIGWLTEEANESKQIFFLNLDILRP